MLDLNSMVKIGARPPPPAELAQAWEKFISHKISKKEGFNDIQAQHLLRTFEHLQTLKREEELFWLSSDVLGHALAVTKILPALDKQNHIKLSNALFQELSRREDVGLAAVHNFVAVLTDTGYTKEATELVEKSLAVASDVKDFDTRNRRQTKRKFWSLIMKGYAREDNEAELLKIAEMVEVAGLNWTQSFHEIMTTFYASRDDVANTKKWYNKTPTDGNQTSSKELMTTVLGFCTRNNELDWCKTIFRKVLDENPPKHLWDVLFKWAAGVMGKGVEDLDRMMEAMIRHNSNNQDVRPDAETINGLVELAMSLQDPYLAERYIALGLKYGIQPNGQTFILQLDYRVSAGDLTGAHSAYNALQSEEVVANLDLPAINKYLRALCSAGSNHYERVVSICSDLDERNARLEPDTVSAVCLMYLSRGEVNDVLDILQANVFHYTLPERASIISTFVTYCLDRNNNTSHAWQAYEIFRTVFQETPIMIRTQVMNEFFARKRSDMACYVFGHMRQHIRKEIRPVLETYIACFRGIGRCRDKESLFMVHNMLKMDSSIEPNTNLYNSLMMAYTECGESERALDFWDNITNSMEGPSYESLELVFKACEETPFGDRTAKEVWAKIRRMEIEVTREVFIAYVCALAGQGRMEEAQEIVDTAKKDLGLQPDVLT
jgi:hypothetical protein